MANETRAQPRKMPPGMKLALELGPIIVFFLAYRWASVPEGATDTERQLAQLMFATAVFIPLMLASLAISWVLTRHLPKMAVLTAVIVVVFGSLTLWLQNDMFIKMKPTVLYLSFAGILGVGLMRGQSYLRYLMEDLMPMAPEGWMKLTWRMTLFFLALAVANEAIWRSMSTDAWVNFKTFGLPVATFIFFMTQTRLFQTYAEEPDTAGGEDS